MSHRPPFPPYTPSPVLHERLQAGWHRHPKKGWLVLGGSLFVFVFSCCAYYATLSVGTSAQSASTPTTQASQMISTPTLALERQTFIQERTPSPTATARPTPQSPRLTPTAMHTVPPTSRLTKPSKRGVNGNPWGYDFVPGRVIFKPAAAFCSYFACISGFWKGNGYVVRCTDRMYAKSGGRSGACSHHGRVSRTLYQH